MCRTWTAGVLCVRVGRPLSKRTRSKTNRPGFSLCALKGAGMSVKRASKQAGGAEPSVLSELMCLLQDGKKLKRSGGLTGLPVSNTSDAVVWGTR